MEEGGADKLYKQGMGIQYRTPQFRMILNANEPGMIL